MTYGLYIAENGPLTAIFPSIYHWIGFFLASYLPAAVLIGHYHLKKQVPTDARQNTEVNPYTYQTTPGKEQDYQLPANRFSYELQLRSMKMTNDNADLTEQAYKQIFNYDMKLPRYTKEEFETVRYFLDITIRLQNGESINQIVKKSV